MDKNQGVARQQTIRKILELSTALSGIFNSPDLDEWRQLNVPMAQLKSLFLIVHRQGMNSRLLAAELGVTPGNVTGIVDRLVEQDLVIRKPDSADRRVAWLEVTPKGSDLLHKLVEHHTRKAVEILVLMDVEDLDALAKGMKGVLAAFERHMNNLKNNTK